MDYEIGQVNISVGDTTATIRPKDDETAFSWHRDSYAFVCVTMLSDCTNMTGGDTEIQTGWGETMKIRGPSKVRRQQFGCVEYPR